MTTTTSIPTTTWKSDPVHSGADFAVRHMVVSTFRGGFADVTGELDLSGDEPRISGAVAVPGIQVKDENLYGHLQSPEFFDGRAPSGDPLRVDVREARGRRRADRRGRPHDQGHHAARHRHRRVGRGRGRHLGRAAHRDRPRTTIDRTAYGLNWNAPLPKGGFALANDVALNVHLEFVPAEA